MMRVATLALALALSGAATLAGPRAVFAAATDYEFQAVKTDVKKGPEAIVSVRIVDKRTGRAVPDAVIFTTRMDMAPEGMETMTTPVDLAPSSEPGVYAFKTNLVMEGGWRFKLAAKVQGEPETVQGELILKAVP